MSKVKEIYVEKRLMEEVSASNMGHVTKAVEEYKIQEEVFAEIMENVP